MDKNYWKDAYKDLWAVSSKKEEFIKSLLEKETEFEVIEIGLGAGSDAYFSGSAADHNLTKGDADLYVKDIDAYVEITGPNIPMPEDATLWVRPDKLENTFKKIKDKKGKMHIFIHVQDVKGTNNKLIRGIILDDHFKKRYEDKEFNTVTPKIRGKVERYVDIKANDKNLLSIEEIIDIMKKSK